MAQHKWHKEIRAWADGAEIQFRHMSHSLWNDCGTNNPLWEKETSYRIKPSKPIIVSICPHSPDSYKAVELTPEVIEALKAANIEY